MPPPPPSLTSYTLQGHARSKGPGQCVYLTPPGRTASGTAQNTVGLVKLSEPCGLCSRSGVADL